MAWKEAAIQKSTLITDAWEISKIYAACIADWVLFGCMIINIVQILPGVTVWPWLVSGVLGVQVVTLDVAGFGLTMMAEHARSLGNDEAADKANRTAYFLIGLMIVTLLLVYIGTLWPDMKSYTKIGENILILVRVVMTVIYGFVVHSLRQSASTHQATQTLNTQLSQQVQQLTAQLSQQEKSFQQRLSESSTILAKSLQESFHKELSLVRESLQQELSSELSQVHESLQDSHQKLSLMPDVKAHLQRVESSTIAEVQKMKALVESQVKAPVQAPTNEPQRRVERPNLRSVPPPQTGRKEEKPTQQKNMTQGPLQADVQEKFDTRAFVFACLQENDALKLSDIQKLALAKGQELSEPTISRYRKVFFVSSESSSVEMNESSRESRQAMNESSSMPTDESSRESSTEEMEALVVNG